MQIQMNNVYKSYTTLNKEQVIINDISIQFDRSMHYAIVGASGSGKSTLLHLLAGFDTPNAGSVAYNCVNITALPAKEREHMLVSTIGIVFQQPYLIHALSVLENVTIKHHALGIPKKDADERGMQLLENVGLTHKAHHHPATLSGGQQQRVAILRALFGNPVFLLADEPTGCLDSRTRTEVLDFMLQCAHESQMGIIVSSHDPSVADAMHTILRLHDGKLEQAK